MLKQQERKQDFNNGDPTCNIHSPITPNMWYAPNAPQYTKTSCDHKLFADDTGIGYTNRNDVPIKIITYNDTADPSNFLVNWGAGGEYLY